MNEAKQISIPLGTNAIWIVMKVATWWIKSCIILWLEAYSMWLHQGWMSCLVCAFCKISSLTKRKSLEGNKENIEVIEAYIKCWFMVSQRSKVWASWLLRLGLCRMQSWKEEHLRHIQLLGRSLVSWSSKKQNSVVLSTAEAEYISAGSCCA